MYGWQKLFHSVAGWNPDFDFLPAIPSAIVLYVSIFLTGLILTQLTKVIVPQPVRGYVLDFILTTTLCGYPFGHGIMRKNHGEVGYLLAMVPVITITLMAMSEGDGNPIGVWVKYYKKNISIWKCLTKNVIQIVAGFSAYRLGMYILNLELHPIYVSRLKDYYSQFCTTDLKVPVYVGFAVEFCGVVYDSWFSAQSLIRNKFIERLIKTVNTGLLVVFGVHLTGMYMHPAMATGHTWGCGETTRVTHILIYWVGPMIGAWLGLRLQQRFSLKWYAPPASSKQDRSDRGATNGNVMSNGQARKRKNQGKRKYFHA